MNWIELIIPLIGVALGWGLSEQAKLWADKRQDSRKLKRLLYFILELRFHFSRELNAQKDIDNYLETMVEKLKVEFGTEVEIGVEMYKPFVKQILQKNFQDDDQIAFLEENIDTVIIDLAEVFPVFAYELSGQHRIKERLKLAENNLSEVDEWINQMPFDFKDWFRPKLTQDLLKDLDDNIERIARRISKSTWKQTSEKIGKMETPVHSDLDEFVNDYIEKIRKEIK